MKRAKRNALRQKAVTTLGRVCVACKLDDYHVLDIDHIYDDRRDDPLCQTRTKVKMHKWIVNNPDAARGRYQVLCCNHNALKQRYPAVFAERFPNLRSPALSS